MRPLRSSAAAVSSVLDGNIDTLVIDLAGVTFLDSTGIGTLVVAKRICHSMGVKLHIRRPNPFIARLFAVVGVSDVLGVPIPPGAVSGRLSPTPRARRHPARLTFDGHGPDLGPRTSKVRALCRAGHADAGQPFRSAAVR